MVVQPNESHDVMGEHWFPVGEVSVESMRERVPGIDYPPTNRIHVWFARRPLITSRAAIVMSILPPNADKEEIFNLLCIPSNRNVMDAYSKLLRAKAEKRKIKNPCDWPQAYKCNISENIILYLKKNINGNLPIFDPFAGGGSIPLESVRLGLDVIANDLNPVAFICLKGTVEYPGKFGKDLLPAVDAFCKRVHAAALPTLKSYFPKPNGDDVYAYLWARTVRCPHCGFTLPLSPNWWIVRTETSKIAARPTVDKAANRCQFEIITDPKAEGYNPDQGTFSGGDAICISCGSTINSDGIKAEAKSRQMGHQLYAVCTKLTKARGRGKVWHFRSPTLDEIKSIEDAETYVAVHLHDWAIENLVPMEAFPEDANDTRPIDYGMPLWRDFFSPRQLLTHATYLKAFRETKAELFSDCIEGSNEWEFAKAVAVYGAFVFDSCLNYDSMQCRWDATRCKVAGALDMQAFPFRPSYAEWNQIVEGAGFEWAAKKTLAALNEIVSFMPIIPGKATITQWAAQSTEIPSASLGFIITDPPYAGNVMYAEMSDFFYVWLKLLIGDLYPDVFSESLTNKIDEAIANPARFAGAKRGQAKILAAQDYAAKMEAAFRECRRILQDDGVLCVMFTHRTREAWQNLAESLINGGFTLHASWPVRTEPGQKFGKANKGALKVTVILYCRKRTANQPGRWETIVDEIRNTARLKVEEYQALGITGPDLIVSVYGPALGVFSDHYPVKDVTGRVMRSGDALDIVTQVVNEYLTGDIQGADAITLSYLNLLRFNPSLVVEEDFARIITVFGGNSGIDALDVKRGAGLIRKEKGKVKILTAKDRIAEGVLNPEQPKNLRGLMDVVHAAVVLYEQKGLGAVTRLLEETGHDSKDAGLLSALAVIGGIREDADNKLISEASIATALLEALGRTTVSMSRRGEKITDY
ncbi:hypothetical protein ASZ90_013440 [hydrocarbon metagenome]|uniref:Uncharacterized protein n=1 Tax=hydrocarbon metagenome TaxID=938273 RepID=A0A0W8F7X4_9ZZZZ|nr:DUF1156 domain-containing protein [Methanothrix sp.]MBP7066716.1 DUF1156 domain-containing protein [Methanothrix sp.]